MVAGSALLGLMACAPEPESLFEVVSSLPVDGDEDVVESLTPELRFSASAEVAACDRALGIAAVSEGGEVLWEPEWRLVWLDDANKVRFELDQPLARARRYALSVDTGVGCVDTSGRPLEPFVARFLVP